MGTSKRPTLDIKTHRPAGRKTAPATGARERLNDTLNAFIAAKAEIDAILYRLQALSGAQFNTKPDEIGWGEVSSLQHDALHLRETFDSAFREGEYAE